MGAEYSAPDDDDVDIEQTLNELYHRLVEKFGWALKDIDDTNLETLIDFLFYKPEKDPNVRIINGKTYYRATKPPAWL